MLFFPVWNLALTVPLMVATPVAGRLLDACNEYRFGLGYTAIFLLATLYILLSALFLRNIKAVK